MKKKSIWVCMVLLIFFVEMFSTRVSAKELTKGEIQRIENMVIIVEPRMKDGTLDVQYEITVKVLEDWGDKPLTRVSVMAPGLHFDQVTALSGNIQKISIDRQKGRVQIEFKKGYYKGESVTFKYSLHQKSIGIVSGNIYRFEFQSPLLTTKIDNLIIKWKADYVQESDCHSQDENYLIWQQENVQPKQRVNANLRYHKSDFKSVSKGKKQLNNIRLNRRNRGIIGLVVILISAFICFLAWQAITKI